MKQGNPTYDGFSLKALADLNNSIKESPDILKNDFVDLATSLFSMTEQQKKMIESCSDDLRGHLNKCFSDAATALNNGEDVSFKVLLESEQTKALYLMRRPPVGGGRAPETGIKIVCCDANCGDWDLWCNG